ncbi:MAG TPA: GNAT family N-acetyltransferase [Solirubrobacteraceae bacterium]|nr:GNAT family N-acetyltransferase [Solirubrobacteraceae bacterium]
MPTPSEPPFAADSRPAAPTGARPPVDPPSARPFNPLPFPDPPLTDGTTTLRPWRAADLQTLVAAGQDPLVHRFRHSLPNGTDEAAAWLQRTETARRNGERLELAITTHDEPTHALGSVSIWGFHPRNRTALVSYWLLERGRGHGRTTSAVTLVARWAFTALGLERLMARVETANGPSQRVVERCGFRHEGTLRRDAVDLEGRRVDVRVYGLLRDELG